MIFTAPDRRAGSIKETFEPGQTFEETYRKYPFAELASLSIRVAKSVVGFRTKPSQAAAG